MYKSNLVVQKNPKLSINAWIYIKEMKKEKKKNDRLVIVQIEHVLKLFS